MKKKSNTTKRNRKHQTITAEPVFICLADSEKCEFDNERLIRSSARWLNKATDWARTGFYENK